MTQVEIAPELQPRMPRAPRSKSVCVDLVHRAGRVNTATLVDQVVQEIFEDLDAALAHPVGLGVLSVSVCPLNNGEVLLVTVVVGLNVAPRDGITLD